MSDDLRNVRLLSDLPEYDQVMAAAIAETGLTPEEVSAIQDKLGKGRVSAVLFVMEAVKILRGRGDERARKTLAHLYEHTGGITAIPTRAGEESAMSEGDMLTHLRRPGVREDDPAPPGDAT